MTGIVTLTMNPAVDVSTSTKRVEPVRKLRCSYGRRDAGGGGVNVARVVQRLGAEVTAVFPAGGCVGQLLKQLVEEEGVRTAAVPVQAETREDFTVLNEATLQQYRFVLPGPHLQGDEWVQCLTTLEDLGARPSIVCASGSLPPGVPDDFYVRVGEIADSWGAKFVLDASGAALKRSLDSRIYLIKPNLREMQELTGTARDDEASLIGASRSLIASGRVEVVALTLGPGGALLITAERVWRARGLPIQPVSTVGAGDSFLGAMVWALAEGMDPEKAFRYGMAGGAGALLAAGTELCRLDDVHRLVETVVVQEIVGIAPQTASV